MVTVRMFSVLINWAFRGIIAVDIGRGTFLAMTEAEAQLEGMNAWVID